MAEVQEMLDFPPAPKLDVYGRLDPAKATPAELRGQAVFFGKGQCVACHAPPYYTDNSMHNLQTERFYKPVMINACTRSGDGRAQVTGTVVDLVFVELPAPSPRGSLCVWRLAAGVRACFVAAWNKGDETWIATTWCNLKRKGPSGEELAGSRTRCPRPLLGRASRIRRLAPMENETG